MLIHCFSVQNKNAHSILRAVNKMLPIMIFGSFSFSLLPLEAKTFITITLLTKARTKWSVLLFHFISRDLTMTIELQENLPT